MLTYSSSPDDNVGLFNYLSISLKVVGVVLVRESGVAQDHVYFIESVLQGPEVHYQKAEKITQVLVTVPG